MVETATPASLGAYIRRRRMELGLTQEELAERIGVGVRQSEVSRLERGRVHLPQRRLEAIARALDSPVGALLLHSGWAGAEDSLTPQRAPAVRSIPITVVRSRQPGRTPSRPAAVTTQRMLSRLPRLTHTADATSTRIAMAHQTAQRAHLLLVRSKLRRPIERVERTATDQVRSLAPTFTVIHVSTWAWPDE